MTNGITVKQAIQKVLEESFKGYPNLDIVTKKIQDAIKAVKLPSKTEMKLNAIKKYRNVAKDDQELCELVGKEMGLPPMSIHTMRKLKCRVNKQIVESASMKLTDEEINDLFMDQLRIYKEKLADGQREEIQAKQINVYRLFEVEKGKWEIMKKNGKAVVNPLALKEQRYALWNSRGLQLKALFNIRNLLKDTGNFKPITKVEADINTLPADLVIIAVQNMLIEGQKVMEKHSVPEKEILAWKRYVEENLR